MAADGEDSDQPNTDDGKLNSGWTLWYDNAGLSVGGRAAGKSGGKGNKVDLHNWDLFLKQVATVASAPEFWSLFNSMLSPSRLPTGSSYHLFRTGIEPKWEDSANERGGKWVLTVPKHRNDLLDVFWLHLVLAVIGEVFPPLAAADVNGIVVSVRKGPSRVSVWTASSMNSELQQLIGKGWSALACPGGLPVGFKLEYQMHKDAMAKGSGFNNKARYVVEGDSPPM